MNELSKDNNTSLTNDTLLTLHVHTKTWWYLFSISFIKIPFIGYLVMAEDEKKILKFSQSNVKTPLYLITP